MKTRKLERERKDRRERGREGARFLGNLPVYTVSVLGVREIPTYWAHGSHIASNLLVVSRIELTIFFLGHDPLDLSLGCQGRYLGSLPSLSYSDLGS